ncbi:MAG: sigma-70 family RNA polymerase sigma factor [Acidobacteria bacterium]|nr:sigma-70 family RNA polymerase sigma factor [Acidobacteriota bacterium]
MPHASNITELLQAWSGGDKSALDELLPLVEKELHDLASHYMRRERPGHILQTTALVNEAYLRLIDQRDVKWQNRAHFFAISACIMRRILLNHARDRRRLKRGGSGFQVSLSEASVISAEKSDELLALDEALGRLAAIDERKGRVVELRFFGGMSVEEVAEVLEIGTATVMRDWNMAKAWLMREMSGAA